jgi:hypothetical protein
MFVLKLVCFILNIKKLINNYCFSIKSCYFSFLTDRILHMLDHLFFNGCAIWCEHISHKTRESSLTCKTILLLVEVQNHTSLKNDLRQIEVHLYICF